MSKAYFSESGLAVFYDSGKGSFSDDCPCGCPSLEGRSIIYVDKHAMGTGDGLTPENAFTSIQVAVDAYPKREIRIQGYGDADCYSAGLVLEDCVFLKGVGDVWLDGLGSTSFGIDGEHTTLESPYTRDALDTRIESVNMKGCSSGITHLKGSSYTSEGNGIYNCNIVGLPVRTGTGISVNRIPIVGCTITNFNYCVFLVASHIRDCVCSNFIHGVTLDSQSDAVATASNCTLNNDVAPSSAFVGDGIFTYCISIGSDTGFVGGDSTYISCESHDTLLGGGGFTCSRSTLESCVANGSKASLFGNYGFGFFQCADSNFINCSASNNDGCGYIYNDRSTFTNCTSVNNCVRGVPQCTPGDPAYTCDL